MKLPTNMYLIAITAAIVALGLVGVFGAGVVSGLGVWPSINNPFGLFQTSEITVHDERPDIVHKVQSLARLETMSYTIEKIVPADESSGSIKDFFFGDEIMLIAHGHVIAGIDLAELEEGDVDVVSDSEVWMMLPATKILVATLDNDETRVYNRDRGWLTRGSDDLETEARREASQLILQSACEDGILERAADEAETQLSRFLELLEFEVITVLVPVGECELTDPDK